MQIGDINMKKGFGNICEIWHGTKNNKKNIDYIPFLGEFKVNYTLECIEEGNLFVGVIVDNKIIQVYEYKISPPKIGNDTNLWFKYPLRYKTEGTHYIQFVIGHQNNISSKTDIGDIEWCYKSEIFNIEVR